MRYFKLQNSNGDILDITTTEYLFHEISGLGFEETNEFRTIGPVWKLTSSKYNQTPVSGKILLSEEGSTTPYQKFQTFRNFIFKSPLVLIYYPFGPDDQAYYRNVRVSNLGKTEINEYGVIDEDISFVPYTPWYLIKTQRTEETEGDEDAGWIWDSGNAWRDSESDTPVEGSNRYRFGSEPTTSVTFECEDAGLVKLVILGPAVDPSWSHHVDGKLVATGGFSASTPLTLAAGERLIIDNTDGSYSMTVEEVGGTIRNVYSMRDFDKECFFNLQKGTNVISSAAEDSTVPRIVAEGHILYATV